MKKVIFALGALTLAGSVMAVPVAPVGIDPPFAADSVSGDIDPPFAPDFMDAFGGDIDPPFV